MSENNKVEIKKESGKGLGVFEKYLTLWVAGCIVVGILLGQFIPIIPDTLNKFEYYNVSIPVAILIWLMIYPMMLKIDFTSIVSATKKPKGLLLTCTTNWLIKPFTMYAISAFFFFVVFKGIIAPDLAKEYLAGAVLL
ncbi:MAG: arsenic resistance protein, partial [Clostridium sp.]